MYLPCILGLFWLRKGCVTHETDDIYDMKIENLLI